MRIYQLTGEGHVIRDGTTKVSTVDAPPFINTNPDYLAYKAWLAAGNVPLPAPQPGAAEIVTAVTQAVQQCLDDFARTRAYDGILSACTYATSTVEKFATEGQYAVQARDATWATCYQIMADVQQGQRPMPTIEQVLAELPELGWPT